MKKGDVMARKREYWVYIMTNRWHTVLSTGVTNNITRRSSEHKSGMGGEFTRKYNVGKLFYLESTDSIRDAIRREKQVKAGSRAKKIALINSVDPGWKDLRDET
jgi:putative endonuclease